MVPFILTEILLDLEWASGSFALLKGVLRPLA